MSGELGAGFSGEILITAVETNPDPTRTPCGESVTDGATDTRRSPGDKRDAATDVHVGHLQNVTNFMAVAP